MKGSGSVKLGGNEATAALLALQVSREALMVALNGPVTTKASKLIRTGAVRRKSFSYR